MRIKFFCSAALLAAVSTSAFAQSTTGGGSINVVQPLTVTLVQDMDFGTVIRPATGTGTATLTNAGLLSVAAGAVALASGSTPQAAQFSIDGEGGQSVSVVVPATFTITNATDTLTITTTNDLGATPGAQTLSGALGAAGTLAVNVGGTVQIPSATSTGLYTGTFTVSAAYN